MGLCSHRKETSSIVCLGNLRRLTSKFFVGIGLMWNFKFDGSLFVSVSKRPGSQGYHLIYFDRDVKLNHWLFFGLTLCSFLLLGTVIFSLACGWGTILGWGFCILEYSPVCRGRCFLRSNYRYVENGGFPVFWNPGFSSMSLECWGLCRKVIFPFDFFIYIFKVFCPPWDSFEALFPGYFVW